MKRTFVAAAVLSLLVPLSAQNTSSSHELDVTASWRGRAEVTDWFDQSGKGEYPFGASVLRLGFGQKRENFDWFVEGEQPTLFGLPDDAIQSAPKGQLGLGASYFAANGSQNVAGILLKQGYFRVKHLGTPAASLRFGRFEFNDGVEMSGSDATLSTLKKERIQQRLIGAFGFSHVGRSFDGADYSIGNKKTNVTLFAARPTQGVYTVHGMGEVKADIEYGALTHQFGAKSAPAEGRVFFMDYHDARNVVKVDNRAVALRSGDRDSLRVHTFGANYLQEIKTTAGTFDVLTWAAGQTGSWGTLKHRAGAFALEGGFQPKALNSIHAWVRAGYDASTGDGNGKDGEHNTFFQALPTPRIYARTPFFNLMNTKDLFGEISLKPQSRVTVRSDFHHLQLSNGNDLWYSGGGAYDNVAFGYTGRTAAGHSDLGNMLDASADITVTKHWSVSGYAAHIFGGAVVQNIYGPNAHANYGYVELNWKY